MEVQYPKELESLYQKSHTKYTVAVRLRPSMTNSTSSIFEAQENKIREIRPKSIVSYTFDEVFEPADTNQNIWESSVKSKIGHFIKSGVNTTILAYGQTGSGKTHTLFGHAKKSTESENEREKGLCEWILEYIVQEVLPKDKEIACSFMQIYKEKVTDLLSGNQINLRENPQGDLVMSERSLIKIENLSQVLDLLHKANSNKIFGCSYIHSESSRSHVVFTLELKNGASLNIVDLCGSEVLTYKFDSNQREETNSINLSLFTLNSVINDLCEMKKNEKKFIPFRNSVLTRILKKSLINEKKTQIYLFCNIAPEEKHQSFSVNTLRFGQTAISIDEGDSPVEEKVNLSQQKRDAKKVSNIIDISPKQNENYLKRLKWEVSEMSIFNQRVIAYERLQEKATINVLFLHAYGYSCCGDDWDNFIPYISKNLKMNMFSIDFPGFGKSEGKKFTSRSEDFGQKEQPNEFLVEVFKKFGFTPKNKVFLIGYDLGGAIALSSAFHQNLKKSISGVIAFHPTWTDKIEKLAAITLPVQLIWFPIENFHLISAGIKMSKSIKESKLYRMNVGAQTEEKCAGYYDLYCEEIGKLMSEFLGSVSPKSIVENKRGKIEEEIIDIGIGKKEEELEIQRKAVQEFYEMISNKKYENVFDSIIKGGENKPKSVRLASEMPIISQDTSVENLVKFGYFEKMPKQSLDQNLPLFPIGRQIHVETLINLCVFDGEDKYLTYDEKNGDKSITHRCIVSKENTNENLIDGKIKVEIEGKNNKTQLIEVSLPRTIELNSETLFKNQNGNLIFEDNVTCKYSSLVTKLMLARCCFAIKDIIPLIDLKSNTLETLKLQKECSKRIFEQMDLRHLVHEGIDNSRFTGTDVGRLAYYGQGNCHHLASVLAALLIPFSKILGWEVIFRAGSFFMTGRDIDEEGNPKPGWSGKPNTKVEDHTWLEIVYKPSFNIFVFDPSFGICSRKIDDVYTFMGKMHISGKGLNGSNFEICDNLFDKSIEVRKF